MSEIRSSDMLEFRKALGSFTTGVTVVTTRGAEGDVGLTANSFSSVSLDPPMVLWSLGKSALSLPAFRDAKFFSVHILSEDQEALSNQFARRGIDKFAGVEVERGPDDIPLIRHCAARFVCRTEYQYEGGDHIIFVGEVVDFAHWELPPLLFYGGRYGQVFKSKAEQATAVDSGSSQNSLGYLLRLCAHQIFRPMRQELNGRNLSLAQYCLMALVAKYGANTCGELIAMLELGDSVPTRDEIEDLVARDIIDTGDDMIRLTPAGAKLHVELASVYKASESAALQELDFDMQQALNLSLMKLIETTSSSPDDTL